MADLVKIDDHVEAAKQRLISQYRGKEKIEGTVDAFTNGAQELENAFYDLYTLRMISTATGEQLDGIGRIVDLERRGLNDEAYRIQLVGKIGINTSKGLPENLISIFKTLTGTGTARYTPYYPAECSIFGDEPPLDGIELLVDGDMEAVDVSAWTAENGATLTKETGSPDSGLRSLRVAYNGMVEPAASQSILTVGRWYLIQGKVRMENKSGPVPQIKNGAAVIYAGTPYDGWYEFNVVFFANDAKLSYGSDHAVAGWVEYDTMSTQRILLDNWTDIFNICQRVIPGGVRLNGIGWYHGSDAFAFADSPDGLGFGDLNNPTVGGKFASLVGY